MRFVYAPFGQNAPDGAAACDGLVPGARLDLSHWANNQTPARLKADTSVEIALRFLEEREAHDLEVVANNHFDTDGVLACWVLLRPELARAHAELIVAAAEAGDFDEWPGDERGLWLDLAIGALNDGGSDGATYQKVLAKLDALIERLPDHEALWGRPFAALLEAKKRVDRGEITIARHGRVALFAHAKGVEELPGPWVHRLAPAGTDRWLFAFADDRGGTTYRYELPRYAWADTVRRAKIASPKRGPIRRTLGAEWVIKGRRGMTGLAFTAAPVKTAPDDAARILDTL